MCCIIKNIFILCVVCVLTMMNVNVDIGAHDIQGELIKTTQFKSHVIGKDHVGVHVTN
jgi:hypothetical protein